MAEWKIVPGVPSEEMFEEGCEAISDDHDVGGVWRYMLSAAPKASEDEELVERMRRYLSDNGYVQQTMGVTLSIDREDVRDILKMLEGS